MLKTLSQKFATLPIYCGKIPKDQVSEVAYDSHMLLLDFLVVVINCYGGAFFGMSSHATTSLAQSSPPSEVMRKTNDGSCCPSATLRRANPSMPSRNAE